MLPTAVVWNIEKLPTTNIQAILTDTLTSARDLLRPRLNSTNSSETRNVLYYYLLGLALIYKTLKKYIPNNSTLN